MRTFIILFILTIAIVNSKLVDHQHNYQTNNSTNHTKSVNSKNHHLLNNHHHLQSTQYHSKNNQAHLTSKTLNHHSFLDLLPTIVESGEYIYNFFTGKEDDDDKLTKQQTEQIEEEIKKQQRANNDGYKPLQRQNCPEGKVFNKKDNKCFQCKNKGQTALYNEQTNDVKCAQDAVPFVQVKVQKGVISTQCKQPNQYNILQRTCTSCPDNFVLDENMSTKKLQCWCDPPNIFKQEQGNKICEKVQKGHKCPPNARWDQNTKKCHDCHIQNFKLQMNPDTKKYQCYCNAPYKLKIQQNGDHACELQQ